MEEQLTMAPLLCLRVCSSSNFRQLHTPRRFDAHNFAVLLARGIGGCGKHVLHAGVIHSSAAAALGFQSARATETPDSAKAVAVARLSPTQRR